jgi:hypothetical protein
MRAIALFPCAALALSACAGIDRITHTDVTALYTPGMVSYASGNGELAVEIAGNPFAAPTDVESIAGALSLPAYFAPARLTTRPSPGTPRNIRLVLAFTGAPGASHGALCANLGAIPLRPAGGEARVAMALCAFERPVSWAVAEGPVGNGPRDAAFQRLMASALSTILPIYTGTQAVEGM